MRDPASPMSFLGKERKREMLHGQKEVSFVSFIIFTLCPDALSLNGSIMIINQSSHSVPRPQISLHRYLHGGCAILIVRGP